MVAIAPFRALRYSPQTVGDFGRVIAPPYDVISPQQQDELYAASPFNVVRLILGKDQPGDREGADRYSRARDTFRMWRQDRVLQRDEAPAVYLYEHSFVWQGQRFSRLGFLALLAFDGSEAQVLAHEATFDGPKADRSKLLDTVKAHLSPVFCIVPDADGRVDAWLQRARQGHREEVDAEVPFQTAGGNGSAESVRVWKIDDAGAVDQLRQLVQPTKVLIADGHHRFGAALSRRHLCPAALAFFAPMSNPALIVRPYHRLLGTGTGLDRAILETVFQMDAVPDAKALQDRLAAALGPGWFGLGGASGLFLARVKPPLLDTWFAKPSVSDALARLDVSILHQLVLPSLTSHDAGWAHVRYTPDIPYALQTVADEQTDWAILTRAIPLPEIYAIASAGHVLPQKSTYFYPKVLSGLLFNPFDEA